MNPEEIKNLSFRGLLDEFLNYLEGNSYAKLTLANYCRTLRKIESFMIKHGIGAYTPEIGMQYYETYLIESQNTVEKHLKDWNAKWFALDFETMKASGKENEIPDFLNI